MSTSAKVLTTEENDKQYCEMDNLSNSVRNVRTILSESVKSIVIVNRVGRDYKSIKKFIDSQMVKAFSKMFFMKPKQFELDCESITLVYECFAILHMKYHLEYYRNKKYNFRVDDNVMDAIIFGETKTPLIIEEKSGNHKQFTFEAREHVIDENTKTLAFDRKGRSIDPKKIPTYKNEANPLEFLKSYETNVRHLDVSIPELLRKSIKKDSDDISEIIDEHFKISSQVLIYTPIFEARIRNLKSHEIKIIPVCGVTGKIFKL